MGKILKTVFGKCGVVSNVVDLVKVPQQIEQNKNELSQIKARLNEVERELAEVSEENVSVTQVNLHLRFTQKENELTQLNDTITKILKAKSEYADIFGDYLNSNIDDQITSYRNQISECQEELQSLKMNYEMHVREQQGKRLRLQHEKQELQERLTSVEAKLKDLQDKKHRKKGELNDNLGKMF
jgi:chromosome segregation ATPase